MSTSLDSFPCHSCQDVHARFRTESHGEVTGRFNERFILSLAACRACVVMDDELNILPISTHIRSITPLPNREVENNTFTIKVSDDAVLTLIYEWFLLQS